MPTVYAYRSFHSYNFHWGISDNELETSWIKSSYDSCLEFGESDRKSDYRRGVVIPNYEVCQMAETNSGKTLQRRNFVAKLGPKLWPAYSTRIVRY